MSGMNFPLLDESRMDYIDGSYAGTVSPGNESNEMVVRHEVIGRNLVGRLLSEDQAVFAVDVSSPYTTYRQIKKCSASGEVSAEQKVIWERNAVKPPIYLRPLVISTVAKKITLSKDYDGVHGLWNGSSLYLREGTILASDQFWSHTSTMESLIRLQCAQNGELSIGSYRVKESTDEGFHFNVIAHPDLYRALVSPGEYIDHRDAILTGALAAGFEILRRDFVPDNEGTRDWSEHPVLRALHKILEKKGICTWDRDDFHAEEAATKLRPLNFKGVQNDS